MIATAIIITLILYIWYQHNQKVEAIDCNTADMSAWCDFVHANINSCRTEQDCMICHEIIILFDRKFRNAKPSSVVNKQLEKLWNRLETKYTLVKYHTSPGALSEMVVTGKGELL